MPIVWKGSTALEEQATSPAWEFGDRVQMVRTFMGPHALCLSSAPLKGTAGTGPAAGMRVSVSRVQRLRGTVGQLTITYETNGQPAQGGQLPPDEVDIEPNKIEKALGKHPLYSTLSDAILEQVKDAAQLPKEADRRAAAALFAANATATKLYQKLLRDFTHFPLYPPVYRLTLYSWGPPASLNAGGYRETPPSVPVAPPTVLGIWALGWIREGDRLAYNGTHWKTQRSWIGIPDLDTDVYPAS